jgi:ATP-binding cassette subfamily F protein 3
LSGLGLDKRDWAKPLESLSGGQRSRAALAKALLAGPDLLLMDEPTNHLDIRGLQWLESFLRRWPGTVIVASHDRYFLDSVASRIWHIDNGRLKAYLGNYSKFNGLLEAEVSRQRRQHEAQQEVIEKEEAFIRRYRAGQRAREARGRAKKLARLERIEAPSRARRATLQLKAGRSAELVFSAAGLGAGYGDSVVLRAGDPEVVRSARIALIGPNGSGKTTLLKTIAGRLDPVEGRTRLGEGVSAAHYWQEAENLNDGSTVLEELLRDSAIGLQQARDLLGRFLFSGDDVDKLVGMLSGGERSRLALAKLVVSGANFLLLDEPTNHLDIPSRQALEEALASYTGTFIFASHDRRLISRLATSLWLIEDGRLRQFQGSLDDYNRESEQPGGETVDQTWAPQPSRPKGARAMTRPSSRPGAWQRQRALTSLEEQIDSHEQALTELSQALNSASEDGDTGAIARLGTRFSEVQDDLDSLLSEWSKLAEEYSDGQDGRPGP